jgi:hypothetical protein
MRLAAVYIPVPEGYVAFVAELPGANTSVAFRTTAGRW